MNWKSIIISIVLMIMVGFLLSAFSGNIWVFFIGGVVGGLIIGLFGSFDRVSLLKHGLISGLIAGLIFSAILMLNENTASLRVFLIVVIGLIITGGIGGLFSSLIWGE